MLPLIKFYIFLNLLYSSLETTQTISLCLTIYWMLVILLKHSEMKESGGKFVSWSQHWFTELISEILISKGLRV